MDLLPVLLVLGAVGVGVYYVRKQTEAQKPVTRADLQRLEAGLHTLIADHQKLAADLRSHGLAISAAESAIGDLWREIAALRARVDAT
jgi:hypothetical protein